MEKRPRLSQTPEFLPLDEQSYDEERFSRTPRIAREFGRLKRKRELFERPDPRHQVDPLRKYKGTPWIPPGKAYNSPAIIALHEEIEDFFNYIIPTRQEHEMRIAVVERIRTVVNSVWPKAEVKIFGSFQTGLYLPTSDIDVVVIGKWKCLPLWTLRDALVDHKVADPETIKVIDKATVPIVKMADLKTEVKVDISFNMRNGLESAAFINEKKLEFPPLAKLVMVLKQFLLQRDLNEVFTGGISSYSLILLTISFLQLHPRADGILSNVNLGVLLLEFLEFYGRHFNYERTAISVKDGGCYFRKEDFKSNKAGGRPSILCIEDPLLEGNDIGRNSYGVMNVKRAFEYAYIVLSNEVLPKEDDKSSYLYNYSVLGNIISIKDEVVEYRLWIHDNFPSSTPSLSNGPVLESSPRHDRDDTGERSGPVGTSPIYPRSPLIRFHNVIQNENSAVFGRDIGPNSPPEGMPKRLREEPPLYYRQPPYDRQQWLRPSPALRDFRDFRLANNDFLQTFP